jgi:dTDP-D-glucose 4,6-dehydratase
MSLVWEQETVAEGMYSAVKWYSKHKRWFKSVRSTMESHNQCIKDVICIKN